MVKKHDTACCAVLFTAAVSGIALASVLYMFLPTDSLAFLCKDTYTSLDRMCLQWQGTLFTLVCAFCFGFGTLRLFPLAILAMLRIARLTLDCYLSYTFYTMKHFLWQVPAAGLLGLLFLGFCRLAYLFGFSRKSGGKKLRYTLQFTGDCLFFCGISTIIQLIFQLLTFL